MISEYTCLYKELGDIKATVVRKKMGISNGGEAANFQNTSEYIYSNKGIFIVEPKATKTGAVVYDVTPILTGRIIIRNRIEFEEQESKECAWNISLGGEAEKDTLTHIEGQVYTGSLEQICKELCQQGRCVSKPEVLRCALSALISSQDIAIRRVYPAIGIYWNDKTKTPALALDEQTVIPAISSQESVLRVYEDANKSCDTTRTKEALQASADLITSMPIEMKNAALVSRGFATIAPLAYELKKHGPAVFPYLYLYGPKGSAKTALAKYCATKAFGEMEMLTSDAVDSQFRLGQEFGASKFPRVIDEAHDIFAKHQSIFKSAATGTLATKRGNKDKTMDEYPALCTFIFTSNLQPIAAEDDAQGAVADRVLVVPCKTGPTFNRKLYNHATGILNSNSFLVGKEIINALEHELKTTGIMGLVRSIHLLAEKASIDYGVPQRRAMCFAEVATGIEIYNSLLKSNGVEPPLTLDEPYAALELVIKMFHDPEGNEEKEPVLSLLDFSRAIAQTRGLNLSEYGIYHPAKSRGLIITTNTLRAFKKQFSLKTMAIRNLKDLESQLGDLMGTPTTVQTHKTMENGAVWGILIDNFDSGEEYKEMAKSS